MLVKEMGAAVGKFVFEDLLCRWGAIEEIVMDNGALIVAGLDWLAKKYHIMHIQISAYSKQANGIVEDSHCSDRESIVKACDGDISRWPSVMPHVFWLDHVAPGNPGERETRVRPRRPRLKKEILRRSTWLRYKTM